MTDKEKLLAFLAERGVSFIELPAHGYTRRLAWEEWKSERGLRAAPFTSFLGIAPALRAIVGCPNTHWSAILHEGGHLLASAEVLGPKEKEGDWFGWEWSVVQHLGLCAREFRIENRDYCINWNGPYGYRENIGDLLPIEEAPAFFQEKVMKAKQLGIVALNGTPLVHPNQRMSPLFVTA